MTFSYGRGENEVRLAWESDKIAKFVEEKGACVYLEDSETNPNTLLAIVNNLLEDEELQTRLKTNASKLAQFDALQHIVQQFVEVAK